VANIAPPIRIPQRPPCFTWGSVGGVLVLLWSDSPGGIPKAGACPNNGLTNQMARPIIPNERLSRSVG
jgi:hypothetical protein